MPIRVFNNYIHRQVYYLLLMEVIAMFFAAYLGAYLRFGGRTAAVLESIGPMWPRALLVALVVLASMVAMGLYHARLRNSTSGTAVRILSSFTAAGVALALLFYLFPNLYLGRGALAFALSIGLMLIILIRVSFNRLVDDSVFQRKILVYGCGAKAANIVGLRRRADQRGFKIAGFLCDKAEHHPDIDQNRLIDLEGSMADYVQQHRIEEIVVAIDDRRKGLSVHELLQCKIRGIQITDVVSFFERETGKVKLDLLYPSWMIFSDGFSRNPVRIISGRIFDIAVALIILFFTWPIMLLVALAIKKEDGRHASVLYRQARVGYENEVFNVLKFRSMIEDAEKDGVAKWAEKDDERITRVGSVMRKYRIDELPQIFNVLSGNMSFVGPRPERPRFVAELKEAIPYYAERHSVKPGITGWAQLCYEYGSSEEDALEKLQYDLYYVKNQNLLFDLVIMLQTAEVVLWNSGAR